MFRKLGWSVVLAFAVTVMSAACGGGASNNTPSGITGVGGARVPTSSVLKAMAGLCTARDQATDAAKARATFFDESHDRLHDIAAALEQVDRTAAGTLLVAKQQAEADLNGTAAPADLRSHLDQLDATTNRSLALLHVTAPPCPP